MEETKTRVVGIDLAKRTYVAHMIEDGNPKARIWDGKTDEAGILKLCSRLHAGDRIGIEACALAFHVSKVLQARVGCRVVVLNAGDLAVIYKSVKKTDLEDAGKLAWLMHRLPDEELPVVAQPSEQEELRRAMVSELSSKKRARTVLINRLHSLFVRQGIVTITKAYLATAERRRENIGVLTGRTLAEAQRIQEELALAQTHIDQIQQEVRAELRHEPKAVRLMSIPGVGPTTAMAFLAHVGDGSRFSRARQVSNFVGMTPRVDSSGETTRIGSITKRGCTAIRSLIVQAAWSATHSSMDHRLKRKYRELAARRGKGRAIVAIARRILELMWVVVTSDTDYWETDQKSLDRKVAKLRAA
jgi:transposase